MLEEYYVRRENRDRMQELRMKRNELLKKVKSLRSINTYQQSYGGMSDNFIEFLEFDNLSGIDEFGKEAFTIEEFVKVAEEMRGLIEPGSVSSKIWRRIA
jgi:hypothetical protein